MTRDGTFSAGAAPLPAVIPTEVNGHPTGVPTSASSGMLRATSIRMSALEWIMDAHPRIEDHNDGLWGGQTGIIYRMPLKSYTPFIHGDFGFQHVGGPYQQGNIGPDVSFGAGVDFRVNNYISWRFVQADYQFSHVNFGVNGRGNFNEIRLSDGIVSTWTG